MLVYILLTKLAKFLFFLVNMKKVFFFFFFFFNSPQPS